MITAMIVSIAISMCMGLFLLIWPAVVLVLLCRILGAAIIVAGAVFLIQSIIQKREIWKTIASVLIIGIGIYVVTAPKWLISVIPFVFGILIGLNGIFNIWNAVKLAKKQFKTWWVSLIIAIVTIGLAVLIILNPFGAAELLLRVIGIVLLLNGIADIWVLSRRYKYGDHRPDGRRRKKDIDAEYQDLGPAPGGPVPPIPDHHGPESFNPDEHPLP